MKLKHAGAAGWFEGKPCQAQFMALSLDKKPHHSGAGVTEMYRPTAQAYILCTEAALNMR